MSGVRGPNSALTEFLRSQGINASDIRDRWERRRDAANQMDAAASHGEDNAEHVEEDPAIRAIAEAAAAKRRADQDIEDLVNEGTDLCAICGQRFALTVYTVPTKDGNGVLCRNCGNKNKSKKAATNSGKKRKVMANALLDLKQDVSPSLQDICISKVAQYIDEVDELGDLTARNFEKIANILTKNRRLTNKTVQLFLQHEVTTLNLADCSQLSAEAYYTIASMCPNLERLTLDMCGQLDNEGLLRLGQLPNLTSLELDGPFQVRAEAWMTFFEQCGERLKRFCVKSVYRFTPEVMAVMMDCCPNLESLSLSRLVQMREEAPIYLLSGLTKLTHLELSNLEPGVVNDESIAPVIEALGKNMHTLIIEEADLSDEFIVLLTNNCQSLETLELRDLRGISDDAVLAMFLYWTSVQLNKSLHTLSFERCIGISDTAIEAALNHAHGSLVELSLNSLKLVTPAVFESISKLPNITKLDLGFIGSVEPRHVYKFSTTALKQLFVFGNIRLSRMPLPENITVVGTM